MAYWKKTSSTSAPSIDYSSISKKDSGNSREEFYEIEPALVLDIILDKNHPYFKKKSVTLSNEEWPADVNGKKPEKTDLDFTWMGRILVRLINTQKNIEKEDLLWALPLDSNISEYPLLNEIVGIVSYLGKYYYTRKINVNNTPNTNANFLLEPGIGGYKKATDINSVTLYEQKIEGNRELRLTPNEPYKAYQGPISKLKYNGGSGYEGALGRYFYFNPRIRSLKRREGDFILESRFGQSIRFAAYDDNRDNDKGYNDKFSGYKDYKGDGNKYEVNGISYERGCGNPMILIRNRQRPITDVGTTVKQYDNLPPVVGTIEEKNVGGYITEDVNNDGSSIQMTSGTTISQFKTNCYKKMWGVDTEEQSGFNGKTLFKYPVLLGDQIVINSDRIILSSKTNETFHFSKKRYAIVTDDEYTVDAHNQIIFTTNNKTVLNSPAIYLGEYNQTNEPVLLGQTSVNWLYELCNWLLTHTHWYKHTHPDVGGATPDKTQTTVQSAALAVLRDELNTLLSRRVFVVGGGFAPGKNGEVGNVKNGAAPVVVTLPSGNGVPGGFAGVNNRTT